MSGHCVEAAAAERVQEGEGEDKGEGPGALQLVVGSEDAVEELGEVVASPK
jgi:hypothetical protein